MQRTTAPLVLFGVEATAAQRMEKLLQAKHNKAGQSTQPTGTAAITPAMRHHAHTRLAQVLQQYCSNFAVIAEATAAQRMEKLLQAKHKKAALSTQPTSAASITPAMRQHARTRLVQALQSNPQLGLEPAQQDAGGKTWEASLFQTSSSKSAYLSKLSNAVSQIKRAATLAELSGLHVRWDVDDLHGDHCAQ